MNPHHPGIHSQHGPSFHTATRAGGSPVKAAAAERNRPDADTATAKLGSVNTSLPRSQHNSLAIRHHLVPTEAVWSSPLTSPLRGSSTTHQLGKATARVNLIGPKSSPRRWHNSTGATQRHQLGKSAGLGTMGETMACSPRQGGNSVSFGGVQSAKLVEQRWQEYLVRARQKQAVLSGAVQLSTVTRQGIQVIAPNFMCMASHTTCDVLFSLC